MGLPLPNVAAHSRHDIRLFGSFHVGGLELALPVDALQEVVNLPEAITRVPLAPDYVAGLFMLRGTMVPVLSLDRLLGLAEADSVRDRRVAVVKSEHTLLGICFDRTGEMLRLDSSQVVSFAAEGDANGLIEGAFDLESRIVQVLSATALARVPGLPQVPRPRAFQLDHRRRAPARVRKVVSFHVDGRLLAIPMEDIHEIVRLPTLEHSVLSDAMCHGWLELRGAAVPVVDLARFLGLESSGAVEHQDPDVEDLRRVVVLRKGDGHVGLLVDDIESIVSYTDEQLLPLPIVSGQTGILGHCINRRASGMQDVTVIGTEALFADPYMAHLAKGHHDLYLVGEENTRRTETRSKPSRETWLIFRLDRLMAVRIEQVVEIVESHGALVRPPGAPPHVCGVVNDGRSLTTVVDLRTLYGMDTTESLDNPKILVVQHNGHRYGLTVASVESIVGIEPGAKIRIPSLVANHLDPELKQDLHEVIDSPEHGSVLLLDVLSLMQRLTG
ncbi:hypothetical protein HBF26_12320 [Luteibacter jiangsuensis]|uniref:CheW-like domain-containing protein n=1 Tax=Luteibacter jiangsuensis TaxID=637577 RepID=A0ABX0Q7A2_9GAMM|nr:hypothetical protein [Luteibacter jiangsuensis]